MTRRTRFPLAYAPVLAALLWSTLGCAGLLGPLTGYGDELASVDLTPGERYRLEVESTGKPVKLWLKYSVKTTGDGFTIQGPMLVSVGGAPPSRGVVTVDDLGVHVGDYDRPRPLDPSGGGVAWSTKQLMTLPAEPEGTVIRIRGQFDGGPHTTLQEARLTLTE